MKALILAAGHGTRLGSLTTNVPKPMLPVQGKPLLYHTVRWLRLHGVTEIAINLHHAPQVIPAYFGDGSAFGVRITYSFEPVLLGTAGAARKLDGFLDERFVVVYGDVFTNVDLGALEAFHLAQIVGTSGGDGSAVSMALYRVHNPTEVGLVDVDASGRIHRFVEKPPADQVFTDLANAGILLCEPKTLSWIPRGRAYDFSRDLFPEMLRRALPLFGRPLDPHEYVIDIGVPDAYARAQMQGAVPARKAGAPSRIGFPAPGGATTGGSVTRREIGAQ